MLRRLYSASIWHPDAIPADEWKYRNLKRVWLPLYDFIAVCAGLSAALFGSRILNRILHETLVDAVGVLFAGVAIVCFAGVAFPHMWRIEMLGKSVLVGMIVAYMAAIILFPTVPPDPNWFIVAVLGLGLPLALFRLNLLGEEWKERREWVYVR